MISKAISSALAKIGSVIKEDSREQLKIHADLTDRMTDKFELLGIHMLNFIFGRLKMYFLM